MVAVRFEDDEGLVVTGYFTDRIKIGEQVWPEG